MGGDIPGFNLQDGRNESFLRKAPVRALAGQIRQVVSDRMADGIERVLVGTRRVGGR